MDKYSIVLYHGGGCRDGFASRWIAERANPDSGAIYVPIQYGQPLPPEIYSNHFTHLYLLDFSLPRETLIRLQKENVARITILDHHATAQADLAGMERGGADEVEGIDVIFDMDQSGCVLTWKYFRPRESVPNLLRLVEDRDLWNWKLESSREINAAIRSYPLDLTTWDWMATQLDTQGGWDLFQMEGEAILRSESGHINSIAAKAMVIDNFQTGEDYSVAVVNSCVYQSEIAERMLSLHPECPFAVVFFVDDFNNVGDNGKITLSLRSRKMEPDGSPGFDVGAFAKRYGGGGHRNAAGVSLGMDDLDRF